MAHPRARLLGPVSLLDCVVFCAFLAPQLILQAGLWSAVSAGLQALPFLLVQLPPALLAAHWPAWLRWPWSPRPAAARRPRSSLFEDMVVRCVRWAFVHMDPRVGRVFFSPAVTRPFHRYRQLRHGRFDSHGTLLPLHWRMHFEKTFRGLWIFHDTATPPDVVIFFVHGGGFVLGSSFFYLEFLLAWASLLLNSGFRNPAIFSLDYTLAPDAVFPAQLHEAADAYAYVLATAAQGDPSRMVVAGDSAGAALVLSLLLHRADVSTTTTATATAPPALGVFVSPWVRLWSSQYQASEGDYVDVEQLANFADQYAGCVQKDQKSQKSPIAKKRRAHPLVSPGDCHDRDWWRRASPTRGMLVTFGESEVFAPEIRAWVADMQACGVDVHQRLDSGPGVHAWPVASVFLGDSETRRFNSLVNIAQAMRERLAMGTARKKGNA